jgi:hypothetical protein
VTTVTKTDGTVVTTTVNPDGTSVAVTTQADGSYVSCATDDQSVTLCTGYDKDGNQVSGPLPPQNCSPTDGSAELLTTCKCGTSTVCMGVNYCNVGEADVCRPRRPQPLLQVSHLDPRAQPIPLPAPPLASRTTMTEAR